jgi:nucleoside-diphosphate-sugar epimerase
MRALITGANGFVGSWLARTLVERGEQVRALVRRQPASGALGKIAAEVVVADVTEMASLGPALRGIEVVFHLAGIRRSPSRQSFFDVNAGGTRNLCEAMARSGVRRLILCSSLAANGPSRDDRPKREEDPFQPEEWYGESKAEAERIAFSYLPQLEVTAVRPCRILGPGDRENLIFFKCVKKGICIRIGGGPRPLSLIDVADVVALLCIAADDRGAIGEAFFATAPQTATLEEIQQAAAAALAVPVRTITVPPFALRALGALADAVSLVSGKNLPLNRKLVRQLLAPAWTCSAEKAQRRLGFSASISIADSIKRSAAWYQREGWI